MTVKPWGDEIGLAVPPDYQSIRDQVESWLDKNQGPLLHPLLSIQKKSVAHAVALRYCCIFDDMGLGKTAQALAINAFGGHKTTFILCPNNVKKVWVYEIKKFLGLPQSAIYIGKGSEIVTLPPKVASRYRFIIFNYEACMVAGKTPEIVHTAFLACSHHILDECHYFRNAHSARFMAYFNQLMRRPPHRLTILTGTPVDRTITDAWPYLAMLDLNPKIKERSFLSYFINPTIFSERYARVRPTQQGKPSYMGYKEHMLPEIGAMFGQRVVHRKIEKIVELKKLIIEEKWVKLLNMDLDEVLRKFKAAFSLIHSSQKKMDEWEKKDKTGDMFLAMIQNLRHEIATNKMVHTLEKATEYNKLHGQVIIFSEFVSPIMWLEKALWAWQLKSTVITGSVPHHERETRMKDFKDGKTPFLLATFGVLSEGENLQNARCMVMNDLPWQPLVIKQAQRRIWRIGQDKECYCCLIKNEADIYIERTLAMKGEMVRRLEQIFDKSQIEYKLN